MQINSNELFSVLCEKIKGHNSVNKPLIIAIDGCSASGKTTFASKLSNELNIPVIHTDDFFRSRNKDGKLEISEFDGNFDINRFKNEAINGMMSRKPFQIGVFDCSSGIISRYQNYNQSRVFLVEGAYSLNPRLGKYADIKVFFKISPEVQKSRIIERNGFDRYQAFQDLWISAENRYFEHYDIKNSCDYIVNIDNF